MFLVISKKALIKTILINCLRLSMTIARLKMKNTSKSFLKIKNKNQTQKQVDQYSTMEF